VLCWGDESAPKGRMMANTWQGEFPWQNLETDGWAGTSPIGSFRANGHGLFDMAGNVWEWTRDFFTPRHSAAPAKPCCARPARRAHPPQGDQGRLAPVRPNHCLRYRPAARQGEAIDTSTTHIGFRCIARP
jgi:formylglycine-generating enzyme